MKILQLQLALFYDAATPLDFDGLSYFVRREISKLTRYEMENLNMLGALPKDMPVEIPRLQLRTPDNKIRLQASLQRFDLFYERINEGDEVNIDSFFNIVDKIFDIHNNLEKKILRVGIVGYKAERDRNPSSKIASFYLNTERLGGLDGLTDVNLMFNRPFEMEGHRFNCHITYTPGAEVSSGNGLLLKQVDVSTLEELVFSKNYNLELIKNAFLFEIHQD